VQTWSKEGTVVGCGLKEERSVVASAREEKEKHEEEMGIMAWVRCWMKVAVLVAGCKGMVCVEKGSRVRWVRGCRNDEVGGTRVRRGRSVDGCTVAHMAVGEWARGWLREEGRWRI